MTNRRKFVRCEYCRALLKAENLPAHVMRTHPKKAPLPRIEIEFEQRWLTVYLPCERLYKEYEGALKVEINRSLGLIEKIWENVCCLFEIKEWPIPMVYVVIGKGVVAHNLAGQAFSVVPANVDVEQKKVRVSNPMVEFTPYTYYVESLMRFKDEPVLAQAFIHEFSHCAFILGGSRNKGLLSDFIWRATNPDTNNRFRRLDPFVIIPSDQTFPLTPATLLLEAPAMWGEQVVVEKLFGNAVSRMERRMEFHEKRDEVLNQYVSKHAPMSPITPKEYTRILADHLKSVRHMTLDELYEYVDRELGRTLGIDVAACCNEFLQSCSIVIDKKYASGPSYDPNDEISKRWEAVLRKEFSYVG